MQWELLMENTSLFEPHLTLALSTSITKKQFSFVLLAIAGANAQFIAFDLGSADGQSDGGIFKHGSLRSICKSEYFPPTEKAGKTGVSDIPYFILGDQGFALDQNLMKPYPHRTAIGDASCLSMPCSTQFPYDKKRQNLFVPQDYWTVRLKWPL